MQDYLLLSEVAQIARTSVDSVRGWVRSGRLRSVKPGRRRLIRREELERFLASDGLAERRARDTDRAGTE
jgi:excisionase family DNA binding protein